MDRQGDEKINKTNKPVIHGDRDLSDHKGCTDQWRDIPTPAFDSIFREQAIPQEVKDMMNLMNLMMKRLCFQDLRSQNFPNVM